ncbi:MAG: hypothetical protein ACLUB5_04040 [Bifidobacterium dentium]
MTDEQRQKVEELGWNAQSAQSDSDDSGSAASRIQPTSSPAKPW